MKCPWGVLWALPLGAQYEAQTDLIATGGEGWGNLSPETIRRTWQVQGVAQGPQAPEAVASVLFWLLQQTFSLRESQLGFGGLGPDPVAGSFRECPTQ